MAATLFLTGFALQSSALTIGRPQGGAWIGKPLDMVIPLTLDPAEGGGALCLEAEVLQGDTRVPDRSLTVSLEPGASPGMSRMRVRTTVAVDEPVVTMNVRAGCDMKSTRSFVLLADVPVEPALAAAAASDARGAASGAAPARRNIPLTGDAGSRDAEGSSQQAVPQPSPRRSPAPAPRRAAPVAQAQAPAAPRAVTPRAATLAAPPPPAVVAEAKRPKALGGSRLQVEALEPVPVANAGLKTATQLTPPPNEDPARRSEAVAQWRALNAAPEATQADAQRLQSLEATLAALREQTAQNQRVLLQMQSELAQARESRYRNPLVYGLIALLLLALVAILLLWRLARRAAAPPDWWREAASRSEERSAARTHRFEALLDDDLDEEPTPPRRSANATQFGAATFGGPEPDDDDDVDDEHAPHPARAPDAAQPRPVNTEELFDVQQQSEFFLSLGQHDQAIAVLREHIAANPGTSALAYLDLLRIFHSLGRKDDYARLAEEFERAFNADVPPFEQFNEAGKGLEHYRSALGRIESQWPAPGTLALIEELVFRKPGVHEDEAFDLAAYQELLLLYAVAKEVIDPNSAPPAPVTPQSFVDTFGHEPTAPAPIETESPPPAIVDGPELEPSIYGAIDDELGHETQLIPPSQGAAAATAADAAETQPPAHVDLDLAEFDKTAFETLRAPIEDSKPAKKGSSNDPHVVDFELFDPETEAEIAPRPVKR